MGRNGLRIGENMFLKVFNFKVLVFGCSVALVMNHSYCAANAEISYAFSDWAPMSYVEKGKLRGLYSEILKLVLEQKMGFKLIPEAVPWKRAQLMVKRGKADLLLTIATPERLAYAIRSESPFYEMPLTLFTASTHPKLLEISKIRSAQDIKNLNLTAVTNRGNGWHQNNIEKFGVKTELVATEKEALHFVHKGRADIIIDALIPTLYLLEKENLKRDIAATSVTFGPLKFYLLMSKKSKYIHLMPQINTVFEHLQRSGKIDAIIKKYRVKN